MIRYGNSLIKCNYLEEWVINSLKNILNNVFTWLNNMIPYLNLGLIILKYWVYNYIQMLGKLEQFNIIN
jgi:hypothetical protein